jgi:multidrug efflux pump subunit AcrA (membrane-fusion protein)
VKISLLAVAFMCALCASCSRKEKATEEHAEEENKKVIEVTEQARKQAEITIETAGPAVLKKTLKLNGKIAPNEDRTAHLNPRFPGIVKSVAKRLGDEVKTGDTLATIESNESLQPYEVKAEIDGTIIKKDIALGEFVDTSKTIFIVADLKTVWVDFSAYREEADDLHVGEKVFIRPGESGDAIESTISYISPVDAENTQTTLARAVVPNPDGQLRPGLFVEGEVVLAEKSVPLAVKANAVQTIDEKPTVFVQKPKGFEPREVTTGEHDDQFVAIKSGVKAGENYAAENSFLLKSELARPQPGEEE